MIIKQRMVLRYFIFKIMAHPVYFDKYSTENEKRDCCNIMYNRKYARIQDRAACLTSMKRVNGKE